MTQIIEFIPIILFFIAYKMDGSTLELGGFSHQFDGIFSATAVLMIATVIQVLLTRIIAGKVEKRLWWLLGIVLVMGAITLTQRDGIFIQWKPTVFNWALSIVFLGFGLFSDKNLLERTVGTQLEAPKAAWRNLNFVYVIYFFVVGALNIFVAYNYAEETWVNYKFWSMFAFTGFILVATMVILFPHLKEQEAAEQRD